MVGKMGKVIVIKERCKGCKLCVEVCPNKLLYLSNDLNPQGLNIISIKNEHECTACALCAQMCPDVALEVYS